MAPKSKILVLDTWAVAAYLKDEPAGEKVEALIADAHENDRTLLMSVMNIAEVWYTFARAGNEQLADQAVAELRQLGIEFMEADLEQALEAAKFKASNKLSLADSFAAALAKSNKAELVTGDKEFRQVESELNVHWL